MKRYAGGEVVGPVQLYALPGRIVSAAHESVTTGREGGILHAVATSRDLTSAYVPDAGILCLSRGELVPACGEPLTALIECAQELRVPVAPPSRS